jgi:hypothetical protein
MLRMCVVAYLMYYFMGNVEGMATQLSGSLVGIGGMTIQANAFIKAGAKVFGKGMKGVGRATKGAGRMMKRTGQKLSGK